MTMRESTERECRGKENVWMERMERIIMKLDDEKIMTKTMMKDGDQDEDE